MTPPLPGSGCAGAGEALAQRGEQAVEVALVDRVGVLAVAGAGASADVSGYALWPTVSNTGSVRPLALYALPSRSYQRPGFACGALVAITFAAGCAACSASQHVASSASYAAAALCCGCQNRAEFGSVQIATSWIHGYRRRTFATKPQ